jgi:hypothetical protein
MPHGSPLDAEGPGPMEPIGGLTGTTTCPHAGEDNRIRNTVAGQSIDRVQTTESTRSRDRRTNPPIATSRTITRQAASRDCRAGPITSRRCGLKEPRAHALANTPYHHRWTRCVHAAPATAPGDDESPLLLHQRLRQLPRDRRRRPAGRLPDLWLPSPPELNPAPRPAPDHGTSRRGARRSAMIERPTSRTG